MSDETSPRLVLRFRHPETHRTLQRTAESLGVSMSDLAEAAIQHELGALAENLEPRLQRTVELLRLSKGRDSERDVEEFAHFEATLDDPLSARRVIPRTGTEDVYGIGAAFARRVERG